MEPAKKQFSKQAEKRAKNMEMRTKSSTQRINKQWNKPTQK